MQLANRLAAVFICLGATISGHGATLERNQVMPSIQGIDCEGAPYDLEAVAKRDSPPALMLILLFQPGAGDDLADKMRSLHESIGEAAVHCVAIGVDRECEELSAYADRLGIRYPILSSKQLNAPWLESITSLPLTLFVNPDGEMRIERVIAGGGTSRAALLTDVAEMLFRQRRGEMLHVAELALKQGEPEAQARELRGYYWADAGNLDDAEAEFSRIGDKVGLATVELAKGNLTEAARLSTESRDAFAKAVAAETLLYEDNPEAAGETMSTISEDLPGWKEARVEDLRGRIAQAKGEEEAAIHHFSAAAELDPLNAVAIANLGSAYQQRRAPGDLDAAREALERAHALGPNPATEAMLRQLIELQAEKSSTQKAESIRGSMEALKARRDELHATDSKEVTEQWETPQRVTVVLAHDPGTVFDRAGMGVLLARELQSALSRDKLSRVVERDLLETLLHEMEDSPKEESGRNPDLTLGKVLSASLFIVMDFIRIGNERRAMLRGINVETTEILYSGSFVIDARDPLAVIPSMASALEEEFFSTLPIRARLVMIEEDQPVLNIGEAHGAKEGMVFGVLADSPVGTIEGDSIKLRSRPVARLNAVIVGEETTLCEIATQKEGIVLAPGMRVTTRP